MTNDSNNFMRKRKAAVEKKITDIQPDKDIRVRLLGTIIGMGNSTLMLDDGSSQIEIIFDQDVSNMKQGQLIRVIARILPLTEGFECKGECIQLLDGFDIELYKSACNKL
ncbi:MAG: hypothetical protein GOV02_04330 [Candidatus Aenigmarchaeota archaeon]|nr:hypothetical protein [Candidatus Aenigmarchaeota archaeon]